MQLSSILLVIKAGGIMACWRVWNVMRATKSAVIGAPSYYGLGCVLGRLWEVNRPAMAPQGAPFRFEASERGIPAEKFLNGGW